MNSFKQMKKSFWRDTIKYMLLSDLIVGKMNQLRWNFHEKSSEKKELVSSIAFTLFMIILMELGRQIAVPGLDPEMSRKALNGSALLRNVSMLTGGQYRFASLFSIGLGPYMTGMILFQAVQLVNTNLMDKISDSNEDISNGGLL